jgi:hypothetical protein
MGTVSTTRSPLHRLGEGSADESTGYPKQPEWMKPLYRNCNRSNRLLPTTVAVPT